MSYFLQSARLGFRPWTEADLPIALELWTDSRVNALLGGPFDADWVRKRLTREIQLFEKSKIQYWPIFNLANGRPVGCAGLQPYKENVPELGYHLRPEFWGQGLAKEAARAVIDFAWTAFDFEALFAGHHPGNGASRHVLLSVGFQYTGEELYPPSGMIEPTYRISKPFRFADRAAKQSSSILE